MSRKGGRGSREKPEFCGVWLDAAQLKKQSRQTLLTGPTSKLVFPFFRRNLTDPDACEFTQTKALRPCIRQTTISSFFIPKPSGKENAKQRAHLQPPLTITQKSNKQELDLRWKEPCGKKSSAESFQRYTEGNQVCFSSATAETQQWDYNLISHSQEVQRGISNLAPKSEEIQINDNKLVPMSLKLKPQNMFLENSYEAPTHAMQEEPNSLDWNGDQGSERDFTQDSEGNQIIAHRSECDSISEFNSNKKMTTVSTNNPSPEKPQGSLSTEHRKRHKECSISDLKILNQLHCEVTLRDQWNLENMKPAERYFYSTGNQMSTWKAGSLMCDPESSKLPGGRRSPGKARFDSVRHEEEQTVLASQLFTQDSQGHTVISHHYLHSSPRKRALALRDRTNKIHRGKNRVESSSFKAAASTCSSGIFSYTTKEPLFNPQVVELPSQHSSLFTQDSEGNVVIKHF